MPSAPAAELSTRVLAELRSAGFIEDDDGSLSLPEGEPKEVIRDLHANHRASVLAKNQKFIYKNQKFIYQWEDRVLPYVADGKDVNPADIDLRVVPVDTELDAAIFRYCSLSWSIPVSQGFGRRTRFLVWDDSNRSLFGIFALGDPVFNLTVRDDHIGWTPEQREHRLYNVLDAFVMGSVDPYRRLLGGKMVALAAASLTSSEFITQKYQGRQTQIRGVAKPSRPVLITTTSALGRSSVYNRVRFGDQLVYKSVGFTKGFGHFQFSDELFGELVAFLEASDSLKGNRFGEGPNWKMRTLRLALARIGLPANLLRHGIEREVFVAPLGPTYREYLRGESDSFDPFPFGIAELTDYYRERWAVPRSVRDDSYRTFQRESFRISRGLVHMNGSRQGTLDL